MKKKDIIIDLKINQEGYAINIVKIVFTNLTVVEWIRQNLPKYDMSDFGGSCAGITFTHFGVIYVICANHNGMVNYDTLQHELYHAVNRLVYHNFGFRSIEKHEEAAARLIGPLSTAIMKKMKKHNIYYEPNKYIKVL